MKLLAAILSVGLSTATPLALAAGTGPTEMTDQQMDAITAGLVNVVVVDVVDADVNRNQVQVAIPVNAAVAANILGENAEATATQPGRVGQRR